MMEIFLDLIWSFEDEGVDKVGMLRPFEDCSGEMCKESVEWGLHVPYEFDLSWQLLS